MGKNIFAFNKTVRGYRHILEDIPCQDNSLSYEDEEKKYFIIAIADGHGDPACYRSDRGSKFAVEMAKKCMIELADEIIVRNMPFDYKGQQEDCVQQLTNNIISKWNGAVRNDLFENPVSDVEIKNAGLYEELYLSGKELEHLYGTTLLACLCIQDYLILIQQGDGRCDVFYDDGSVNQPIPWDNRCEGSVTTSMCDKDVFTRIRSKVINLECNKWIACYIGSDGVEDSYYCNEEQRGTHRFYMDLTCKLGSIGSEKFDSYLDEMLSSFSETGSTDDVSVAGIVNMDKIGEHISDFSLKVSEYDDENYARKQYEKAKSKIISMTRKRKMLSERVLDTQKKLDELSVSYKKTEEQLCAINNKLDMYTSEIEKEKKKLEDDEYQLHKCEEEKNRKEEELKLLTDNIKTAEYQLVNEKMERDEYDNFFQSLNEAVEKYESERAKDL